VESIEKASILMRTICSTCMTEYLDVAGHELFALVRSRKAAGTREATRAHEVVTDALDSASVLEVIQHT
jgi:hypothetical protein